MRRSLFTRIFLEVNAISAATFAEWVFLPGMLFGAKYKWWGDMGARTVPHEGLDILSYRENSGAQQRIGRNSVVPVMYPGVVTAVVDDFLGKSVFVSHSQPGSRFFTLYGHLCPLRDIAQGKDLAEGEVIGQLAPASGRTVPAHLHISAVLLGGMLQAGDLSWGLLQRSEDVLLLDPLMLI